MGRYKDKIEQGAFKQKAKKLAAIICLIAFTPFVLTPSGFSLPSDWQVENGEVSVDQSDNTLTFTVSDGAIINFINGFNIGLGETVRFIQPSATSSVLNRDLSGSISEIAGSLLSNGIVFLINSAGIHFASTADINVGSLVASGLNINSDDFLSKHYTFGGDSQIGTILNEGRISVSTGGFLALLGGAVENTGVLLAQAGSVALASGEKMTLSFDPNNLILVAIDDEVASSLTDLQGNPITSAVHNTGTVSANGGKILMTAKAASQIFDKLVNQEGVVSANSVVNNGGVIELIAEGVGGIVRNAGTLMANGTAENANGGTISMRGDYVVQRGTIQANADDHGFAGNISLVSDSGTLLVEGSRVEAHGLGYDSVGGNVYINSLNGSTDFRASALIDVSGGSYSGNAGSIEISAHDYLGFQGHVIGTAQEGFTGGTVFFDPLDIRILNTGINSVDGGDSFPGPDETFAESPGLTLTFNPQSGGAFTGFNIIHLQATRDINILSPFDGPTAVGLGGVPSIILEAGRDINVNENLSTTNASILLRADRNVNIAANKSVTITGTGDLTVRADANNDNIGNFTMSAGSKIQTGSGNMDLQGAAITLVQATSASGNITAATPNGLVINGAVSGNDLTIAADSDGNKAGAVTMATGSSLTGTGNVTVSGAATTTTRQISGNNVSISSVDHVTLAGPINGSTVTITGDTDNSGVGTVTGNAGSNITAAGAVNITGVALTTLRNITTTGNIVALATGAVSLSGILTAINVDVRADSDLNKSGALTMNSGSGIAASGSVFLRGAGNMGLQDVNSTGGNLDFAAVDNVSLNKSISAGTTIKILADSDNNGTGTLGAVSGANVTAPGNIDLKGATASLRNVTSSGGNVLLQTTNNLTLNGAVSTTGSGTIIARADSDNNKAGQVTMASGSSLTGASDITVMGAGTTTTQAITTTGGNVNVSSVNHITLGNVVNAANGVTITADTDADGTGTITGNSGSNITAGGLVNLAAVSIATLRNVTAANIVALATGAIGLNGTLTANTVDVRADSDLNKVGALTMNSGSAIAATGNVLLRGAGNMALQDVNSTGGDLDIATVDNLTLNKSIGAGGMLKAIADSDNNGTGTLSTASGVAVTANGAIDLEGATVSVRQVTSNGGNVLLQATNNLTLNGAVSTTGAGTIIARADSDNNKAGQATMNSGSSLTGASDITVSGAGTTTTQNINAGGNVLINSVDHVTLGNAISATGSVTVAADTDGNGTGTVTGNAGSNIAAGGPVSFTGASIQTLRNITTPGNISAVATGGITLSGALSGNILNFLADFDNNKTGAFTMNAGSSLSALGNITIMGAGNSSLQLVGTTGGNINVGAIQNVVLNQNMTTNGGTITLNADLDNDLTGTFVQASGAGITSNGGNIAIKGTNSMTLRSIDAGTGDVTIQVTSGNIDDDGSNTTFVKGNLVSLSSTGGRIGTSSATGQLDLSANQLNASATNGSIFVQNDKTLTVNNAAAGGAGNDITVITTAGDINFNTLVSPDDITLQAAGGIFSLGPVLTADLASLKAGTDIGTAASPLLMNVSTWVLDARTGSVYVGVQSGNLTLNSQAIAAGVSTIGTSKGNILTSSAAGSLTVDVNAGSLTSTPNLTFNNGNLILRASNNVNVNGNVTTTGTGLQTYIADKDADNVGTFIQAAGKAITAGAGTITISSAGSPVVRTVTNTGIMNITSTQGGIFNNATNLTAGTLNLTAATGTGTSVSALPINAGSVTALVTGVGDIFLNEANAVTLTNLTTTDGSIGVTAGNTITAIAVLAQGVAKTVTLTATTGNILVDQVQATGNVNLMAAAGSIDEQGADAAADIVGNAGTFTSANGIGNAGTIETSLNTIDANVTAAGNVDIAEADALVINNIVTANGAINVLAGGDINLNTVTAAGAVNLTAGGSILDANGAANNISATADSSLTAGNVIGSLADPLDVNIPTGDLSVSIAGSILGISGVLSGVVLPANALTVIGTPPGLVIFNSAISFSPISPAGPTLDVLPSSLIDLLVSNPFLDFGLRKRHVPEI